MQGCRLPDVPIVGWTGTSVPDLQPGEYHRLGKTLWMMKAPNGEEGAIDQTKHTVVEHEDGTITVSPSILIYPHRTIDGHTPGWHGYLERGIWITC